MHEQILTVTTPDGDMSVVAKHPDGDGPFPVVVLFHDGPGVRPSTHDVVRRVAEAGYYVVSPDRYHRNGQFVHMEPEQLFALPQDSPEFKQFMGMLMGTTDDMVRSDVDALLSHLDGDNAARPAPMGCIGYCIGARSVVRAMADHPERFKAGVGMHPSFCVSKDADSPHLGVAKSSGSFYFAWGALDKMQPVDAAKPLLEEFDKLGSRASYDIYPGADHGFAVTGGSYHAEAADQAYAKALDLFAKTLK
jgi:carboxymethylenebutenolidase